MYVQQHAFTLTAKLKPNTVAPLREVLKAVQQDPANNPIMPFGAMPSIHFARWFIMDNLKDPEGRPLQPMLGFSSNFDGELEVHLNEILQAAPQGFDAICQYCEDYPAEGQRSLKTRTAFMKRYYAPVKLFWGSKFGHTVKMMRDESRLRHEMQGYISSMQQDPAWRKLTPVELHQRLIGFVRGRADLQWALSPAPVPSFGAKVHYYGKIILILLMILVLFIPVILPFLIIWVLIGRHYEKQDDKQRPSLPPLVLPEERYQEMLSMEDIIFQNQLTVYGTIKKPYWFKRTTLKLALTIFALNGAYRSTKGKLSGIPTIHFARWVIFNKDQNVMFLSNYDGNWENYLSEFIERSAGAMNVSFGQMVGYPHVKWFIQGGAHDEQQFKALVRANQYPSQVFYSAYPWLQVRNILNNAEIRKGLSANMNDEALKAWLLRFY